MTSSTRFTANDVIVLGWDDLHTLTFFLPLAAVNLCGVIGSPEGEIVGVYSVVMQC